MAQTEKPYQAGGTERSAKWRLLGPLIALVGGMAGLVGAFIEEALRGRFLGSFVAASIIEEALRGRFLGSFVAAPIIEEVLKPAGVYLIMVKWPQALYSRWYTAFLAALGGLAFGIIENIIYTEIYFPQHSPQMVLFRYTAGLLLHTGCSFIVGFGINQKLLAAMKGDIPFLSANKRFFIIPMVMHSAYNVLASFLFSRWF